MPFGLYSGPTSQQAYINDIIKEFLDDFVTCYLNDLLIYSETYEEHVKHIKAILEKLREANLPIDIDKCEFYVQKVKYLGLIIITEGIEMDPTKVEAIQSQETLRNVKDV